MNKRLFVLICSIILFQYIYTSACQDEAKDSTNACTGLATSATNKKCVEKTASDEDDGKKCKEDDILCTEKKTGNPDNDFCGSLKVTDTDAQECVKEGEGCALKTISCTKRERDATEAICKKLSAKEGKVCKLTTVNNVKKCIEEDAPENGANNLKYSLALLIFLFLF